MVQVSIQTRFSPLPFNSDRVNLHRHLTRSANVVLLIHGLGGSAAKTWRDIPSELFGDTGAEPFDVALYDYPTLFRRRWHKSASLHFYARQLHEQLREFVPDYEMAFLVGHSLGGLLARDVARHYLTGLGMGQALHTNKVSGLLTVATPLAGTPLARRWFSRRLSELATLESMAPERLEVDQFFASNTIAHNLALPPGSPISLPHYAITAGSDGVVPAYSSIHGAPDIQQHRLLAGHSDVLVGPEVPSYIRKCFTERRQVLAQQARITRPAFRPTSASRRPIRYTRLISDHRLPRWEFMYHETRQARLPEFDVIEQHLEDLPSSPLHCLSIIIDERSDDWRALLDKHESLLRHYSRQPSPPLIGIITLQRHEYGASVELRERLDASLGGGHAYYLRPCGNIGQAEQEVGLLMELVGFQRTTGASYSGPESSSAHEIPLEERWGDR